MLQNYFKIALRNLWRNKAFSAINIFGLAIGIATCLLIMLFVLDELSYDRHFSKANQIYRMALKGTINHESLDFPLLSPPAARQLNIDYPEVVEATRLRENNNPFVTYGDKTFKENSFVFADSNFFQVFSIPFLKGDPQTALTEPNTIVITQAIAQKYFGAEEPIGKVLQFKNSGKDYKVTGVIDKVPANSHFHYDLFATMLNLEEAKSQVWLGFNFYTYLVLPPNYDYKQLEAKMPDVVNRYVGPEIQRYLGISMAEFRKAGNEMAFFLQPLTDIHLRSHLKEEAEPNGDIRYVYIFSAIALFMLAIACINFMNLSTAGAAKRAKEVGVRKVLGSVKEQLIGQFLTESVMLAFFSVVLAVILVWATLPIFNGLTGKELSLPFLSQPLLLPGLLLLVLLVGLLAGSYPAFFLSSFRPIAILKGMSTGTRHGSSLRQGLVVFQFFISVSLMVGTTVVYRQLTYMQNKKVGFDREQVMVIQDTYTLKNNEQAYKNKLLENTQVVSASVSGFIPVGATSNNNNAYLPEDNPNKSVVMRQYNVDHDYLPTLGMELVQGRNFSKDFATDSSTVILNEAAIQSLGWQKNPLGRKILAIVDDQGTKRSFSVIGVVKDFHFESMHQKIGALIMFLGNNSGNIVVKAKAKDMAGLLATFKKQWNEFPTVAPFSYSFMDERFEAVYRAEQKIGQILGAFAGLTIFIACLGLFGLATFTAQQRTKEIGVRKVLGATVTHIVALLSKEFLKLVLIANFIAWPLAWWGMHTWLQDFAYRTEMSWWIFALAGVFALLIALCTVSYHALKAAVANPVKSLRME